MATTARTPADQHYLDSLSDRKLMEFREYLFSSTYITHNASRFLDTAWVDIALLRDYLKQSSQTSASDTPSATRFSTADQQYLNTLSNRQLRDFREYLFSAAFIQQNPNKFLDHDWLDITLLKNYPTHTSQNLASAVSAMHSTTVPDTVHAKIEAQPLSVTPVSSSAVKVECHEVIEISSDSEPDADNGSEMSSSFQTGRRKGARQARYAFLWFFL
ncbi:hypothetical protein MSAN_00248300 [Mycena sanguinolenta]|uniref:Uncharacterized protein n=1 Tax=Mycena sanguinolenta TaxID=230812 RepID=A0A8H7DK07_9AGAR|nr:hypothetical protein MSAN_00248300 [Mycena sanguinolenta]